MLLIVVSLGVCLLLLKGRLPCSSTVSEHCDWKQHTVIVAGTLRQSVYILHRKKRKKKEKLLQTHIWCSLRSKQMDWGGSMKTVCIAKSWLERVLVMPTHAKDTQCHENTHIHCICSTWTCTISGFPRWTKRNRALLFEKGLFCFLFFVFFFFDLSMLWWCKRPFYLMCPSRMWLALFRLCQCLSTSGPDRRSTWCPIRVVLLAMCAVKNPSSLQLCNTVCGSVFSQCEIQAQLCTRRCSVAWFKKKNEIKQVPILCTYSLLFLLFGLNGEFPREGGAHLFADAMQHVQKAKLFFFFFGF